MNKQDILNMLNEKLTGQVINNYFIVDDFSNVLRESIEEDIKKLDLKCNYYIYFSNKDSRENRADVWFTYYRNNDIGASQSWPLFHINFHKEKVKKYYSDYKYKDFQVIFYNQNDTIKDRINAIFEDDMKASLKEQNEFNESVDDMKKIVDVLNVGFDECIAKLEKIINLKYNDDFKKNVEGKNEI